MVPPAGIEPALPKERDFESRASTSSARGAKYKGLDWPRMIGGGIAGSSAASK